MDTCVILAAGKGKRFKSKTSKLLYPIMGKPLLEWTIEATSSFKKRIFVLGYQKDEVGKFVRKNGRIVIQDELLGTGDALLRTKSYIDEDDFLVVPGDVPLVSKTTLKRLTNLHKKEHPSATILAVRKKDPSGYGRIIQSNGKIKIVEEKDANEKERKINLVNTGIYCFKTKDVFERLNLLDKNNVQGEYYLTDVFETLPSISLLEIDDEIEVMGINTREELAFAEGIIRQRISKRLMENGVSIKDPSSVYIEENVKIGRDTVIFPYTFILGKTKVGECCTIGPYSFIENAKIGDGAKIVASFVCSSTIDKGCNIEPYSYIIKGVCK
ncbi:TPA: bifunctional UDP-N-acetylglucosamine diphosphorylase/glucosamine-1-phosphate N-acetyltransferase GlmU [bacterium]|nr:bifunctional UDP-N-acetylglucosamine diphosphorylase/glucosamine-1-phosphate N-acetyltransferase GlmU [bacterium]